MNNPVNLALSGTAAAVSLTLMHECAQKTMPHPPRLDVLGMRTVAKLARGMGAEPPEHLRATAMVGDLVANSAYYSLAGCTGPGNSIGVGAALGAAAGIGVLLLPGPMGLGSVETNRTLETQVMAAGMYLAAGLIAGGLYAALSRKSNTDRRFSDTTEEYDTGRSVESLSEAPMYGYLP